MITRMALKKMILYKSRNNVNNLSLGLHVPIDNLVMIMNVRFTALQKMIQS